MAGCLQRRSQSPTVKLAQLAKNPNAIHVSGLGDNRLRHFPHPRDDTRRGVTSNEPLAFSLLTQNFSSSVE